jgi:hypothetical protein
VPPLAHPAAPAPETDRRLEARLAVYAQHAALVAEQAAAVAAGDLTRAAALDEARVRAAEHFTELQTDAPGAPAEGATFRAALDAALAELSHQGAVDVALAQRLVALREAVLRGAAWAEAGSPGGAPPGGAGPALRLPAPASEPSATAPLEGALVAARAARVGGVLGGQFPGRDPGRAPEWASGAAPGADAPRLDLRF